LLVVYRLDFDLDRMPKAAVLVGLKPRPGNGYVTDTPLLAITDNGYKAITSFQLVGGRETLGLSCFPLK
jgi:hypothetical protein